MLTLGVSYHILISPYKLNLNNEAASFLLQPVVLWSYFRFRLEFSSNQTKSADRAGLDQPYFCLIIRSGRLGQLKTLTFEQACRTA